MKNIYQDDSYSPNPDDIFSSSKGEYAPGKAEKTPAVDFTEDVYIPSPAESQRPVRSARQAPPPIRKTAPVVPAGQPQAQPQQSNLPPYGQQPYYPQPVYYQADPNQPVYPVYGVPGQPYPVYPQGYPQQMPVYPQQMPGYAPQPVYPQQTPSAAPYNPQQGFVPSAPVSNDPLSQEAGTRVLFQSPDFDKKDEATEKGGYETLPHTYGNAAAFDVSEVELPSRKRAGTPPESPFKIDEMEIGTYELGAMSVSRSAKVTGVAAPDAQNDDDVPLYSTIHDEQAEEFEYDDTPEEETENTSTEEATDESESDEEISEPVKEKKKLSGGEKIRRVVLIIALIAMAVSAYMLYNEYRMHKENENAMNSVSDLIITEPVTEPSTENTTEASNGSEDDKETTKPTTTKPTTTRYLTPSEQFELLKQQNPDITFPANIQLKYAKLYAENQDFVGYLSAENTDLDFPIVQGKDNDEYIEQNFFGEYTKYGCPFMTAENNPETLDMNTVIYGHHMRDGSLFAALDQYTSLEGYKEAPVISYNTLYNDYKFKVIAVMITNIKPEDDNGYVFNYFWTNLNSTLNYTAYLNQLSQRSLYDTGVNVLPTDRLLTLSTCYSEFDDARLVVVARLVRPGESAEVDTSKAVENPNPRYPQAYYDENKLTNPYKNAYKWEIA